MQWAEQYCGTSVFETHENVLSWLRQGPSDTEKAGFPLFQDVCELRKRIFRSRHRIRIEVWFWWVGNLNSKDARVDVTVAGFHMIGTDRTHYAKRTECEFAGNFMLLYLLLHLSCLPPPQARACAIAEASGVVFATMFSPSFFNRIHSLAHIGP